MNWALLKNSLVVSSGTTVLALGFGLIAALWLATLQGRWRAIFLALAAVALALPPFLVTNTWLDWLGDTGAFRTWLPFRIYSLTGTIWLLALMLWPITLFVVLSAWRRLEAAQFDCEPAMQGYELLRSLLLPAARGELALAAVLTFVLALNNFAVPVILQTQVLPEEMWVRFNTQLDALGALQLGIPLVIAPTVLLVWTMRRTGRWPRTQEPVSAGIFRRHLNFNWRLACAAATVALCILSVGSPLAQIMSSKRTWTELAGAVEAGTGAIWNSLSLAVAAATITVAVSLIPTLLGRKSDSATQPRRWTNAWMELSWLPFFIPGVLISIVLIKVFNRPILVAFYHSAGIVVLAFLIRYFAVGNTAVRHTLGTTDSDLTDAARLEGASRWQLLRHVQWPQIAPQVLAAWYVVYLLCLWDVESMVLVVPPGGETLALRIFNLLHYGHATQVNALCVALLGLAIAPLIICCVWRVIANIQTSASKAHARIWSLGFLCCLLLGVCCFGSGCSPTPESQSASLHSRFFERAIVMGTRGVGIGEFNKPRSVALDTNDNFYAVDMTGRVQKFTPEGKYILSWQMPQTTLGKPKGMGRDLDGNIIVLEPHYQRVNHFSTDGKLLSQWGCRGTNTGCFLLPRGIAENSHGEFLVSEYQGAERVQRFKITRTDGQTNTTMALLAVIGQAGTAPGEFNRPEGVCVDAQDRIYVADSCNHRIQVFSSDGKFIREYGRPGTGLGELSYPYDITVDKQGYQYVCEFGNSRIQIFDANCQPVEIIGCAGAEPGQFANPWGLALDSRGNLYVADALNHRVQKLVRRGQVAGANMQKWENSVQLMARQNK